MECKTLTCSKASYIAYACMPFSVTHCGLSQPFAGGQLRMGSHGYSVVMINSVSGKRSNPLGGVAYNASKFGMTGLGSCVAEEERENGIRITNVFPGEVNTPILDQRPVPPSVEHRAGILQPQDIAEAVMMLARLHPRAHIPELVIKPTSQSYV